MWCYARFVTIRTISKTWKQPWRSVTFSNGCFSPFLNFKLYNRHQITQSLSHIKTDLSDIVRKGVSAHLSFFISLFFRNMHPPPPPFSWHPSRENTRFYDNTLESGRLKTINIKPWKATIETAVCLKYWMCPGR